MANCYYSAKKRTSKNYKLKNKYKKQKPAYEFFNFSELNVDIMKLIFVC